MVTRSRTKWGLCAESESESESESALRHQRNQPLASWTPAVRFLVAEAFTVSDPASERPQTSEPSTLSHFNPRVYADTRVTWAQFLRRTKTSAMPSSLFV